MLRRIAALLALTIGSESLAVTTELPPLYGRVAQDLLSRPLSNADIGDLGFNYRPGLIENLPGKVSRLLPKAGALIKYGNEFAVGASLIAAGLTWYYNEVQREALGNGPCGLAQDPVIAWSQGADNCRAPASFGELPVFSDFHDTTSTVYSDGTDSVIASIRYPGRYSVSYTRCGLPQSSFIGSAYEIGQLLAGYPPPANACPPLPSQQKPTLAELVRAQPAAGDKVRDIMRQFLTEHPDRVISHITFSSPQPNANQIADAPIDHTLDSDGDGVPDWLELHPLPVPLATPAPNGATTFTPSPSDPNDPASKPATTPAGDLGPVVSTDPATGTGAAAGPCVAGQTKDASGACVPDPATKVCPAGQSLGTAGECAVIDPGNLCGELSLPRLVAHLGDTLHDLIFPCHPLDWGAFRALLADKFPFSIALAVGGFVQASSTESDSNPLPTDLGPFHVDFSWAASFLAFIKVAFRTLLWLLFFRWMLEKVAGQVVLS